MKQIDLAESERLQPSLLDRLTDREPGQVKESARERVIDVRKLREIIQRDLGWLLNTANNEAEIDPELYPHASSSTLNYGIADIAGKLASNESIRNLEAIVKRAVLNLEPRLIAETLEVATISADEGPNSQLSIDIRGELWASPVPVELFLRTHFNVADGDVVIDKVD